MRGTLTFYLILIAAALAVPRTVLAGCTPVADNLPLLAPPRVWLAATPDDKVEITFLGHASFEIASPGGVRAVTDYNGVNVPNDPPDIATMNHAHSTHYTLDPDPRIPHVLHGWRENGQAPSIDLTVGDMHVSNLPTKLRAAGGGTEIDGNSIFIFETAGLCIAHLSHLHHLLEPADVSVLGHIDVLMVAVDGTWTLSQEDAAQVVDQLQPRVVVPMHFFTRDMLERFLALERDKYAIEVRDGPAFLISRATLPATPTIIALPGGY